MLFADFGRQPNRQRLVNRAGYGPLEVFGRAIVGLPSPRSTKNVSVAPSVPE